MSHIRHPLLPGKRLCGLPSAPQDLELTDWQKATCMECKLRADKNVVRT